MKNKSMTGEKETGSPDKAPSGQAHKKTFCRICEVHCGLRVDFDAEGAITSIRPDHEYPVSQGYVCAKGTRFLEVANHPERLMHPLVRQPDGTYQQVSWKEALDYFKDRIRPILKTFGPHAIAMYFGTPAIHNALGALAYVGLARALGTRNLYSAGSQDNDSKFVASRLVHGNEWIAPIMDLEHTDFALLFGTNPAVSQGTYMHLPAWSHEGVLPGMVVVPHGLPEANVNTLIGSDRSLIEPLSGMHRMTGNQVQVKRAKTR